MGKRVNLAELAREAVPDSYSTTSPTPSSARGRTDHDSAVIELDSTSLAVGDIAPNPLNERDPADDEGEEFEQLVSTIRLHGVLQPIVVCSSAAFVERYPSHQATLNGANWVALIGNRRLRASIAAGKDRVPALVNDERLASMQEVMLIENSHRKNLSPLREAAAMQTVLTEANISQRQLAERIGRTNGYVSQRIALLNLIPVLQAALEGGHLKLDRARELGGLPHEEQQEIADGGPPFRRRQPEQSAAKSARRRIAVGTPVEAAESIRQLFSPGELAELIRLLSEQS